MRIKTLTVTQFKQYCDNNGINEFVFCSADQNDSQVLDMLIRFGFVMKFNSVCATTSPASICFLKEDTATPDGSFRFNLVKNVRVEECDGKMLKIRIKCRVPFSYDESCAEDQTAEYIVTAKRK